MRLQRWFNDNIWRPAKGYTARGGTWRYVGAGALAASLFGAAMIVGGGAANREAPKASRQPVAASSHGFVGWWGVSPSTTTSQPPAPPAPVPVTRSEPSGRRRSLPSASPRSAATCDRPSTCPQLRQCENGGSYSHGTSGSFDGAYQFADKSKWGMTPAQQDAAADEMYAQRGSQPWPVCGKFLR